MTGNEARRATVVGAGIGGLTAAVGLRRQGWNVTVLERARALEPAGAALGIAPNALHSLDAIGLGDEVRRFSAVQGQGGIRRPDGRWLVRTDLGALAVRFGDPQLMTLRADLVGLLAASLPDGALRTGVAVTGVDAGNPDQHARVFTTEGELGADLVVAADGIHSLIRTTLFPDHPGPRYSGFTAWRFVAALPAGASPAEPSETWGRGTVFGIVPLSDGRVYCYASAPASAGVRHDDETTELKRKFATWHDPIPGLISAASPRDVLHDDVHWIADPLPAYHRGRVAILGDAAHAMTPHLGQGACQAIEDAVVLASVAGTGTRSGAGTDLAAYTSARMRRTRMVADSSYRASRLSGDDIPGRHRPAEHRDLAGRAPRSRSHGPATGPDSRLDAPHRQRSRIARRPISSPAGLRGGCRERAAQSWMICAQTPAQPIRVSPARLPYDSKEGRALARDVIAFVNYTSKLASAGLAASRGPCPAVGGGQSRYADPAFLARFTGLGASTVTDAEWTALAGRVAASGMLRNSSTVALPPTGRSAPVIGASAGIEPLFRLTNPQRPGFLHPAAKAILDGAGHGALAVKVAGHGRLPDDAPVGNEIRDLLAVATQIPASGHLAMVSVIQSCVDEAVAKTVNLPASTTVADAYDVFQAAWEAGCKGITIYRDGSRSGQPKAL